MGPSGAVVSTVSLSLEPDAARSRPSDWVAYIYAALEQGISAYEVNAADPLVVEGLSEAMSAVDRRLVFVSWRLGAAGGPRDFSATGLTNQVRSAIARTGLEYLDAVMLDEPLQGELTSEGLKGLADLKASGATRFCGLSGQGAAIDDYIARGGLDILTMPYNLTSGWSERNRMRSAVSRDMAVVGSRPYPQEFHAQVSAALKSSKGPRSREPLAGIGTYAFLDSTPGWTAEEICLAYALTESSLASVQAPSGPTERLERLAAVTDREMPPGLSAQIEMARFAPTEARQSA
jgi:aryl-alcohol dehydrogenase-like predicted oxidoreductase